MIKCPMCGYRFSEEKAAEACKGCVMPKGCKLIKCPGCGYEIAPEPKWLKKFLRKRG